ncbi:MAG: hypothetical protein ACJ8GN_23530 [Longimicrobiaceae bacterium]
MSAISKLTERLGAATSEVQRQEDIVRHAPRDFAARMTLESLMSHIDDLRAQLHRAKLNRAVEVVQIHLEGEKAYEGSLPLYLVSKLADQFSGAVHAASQKIKTGRPVQRISTAIVDLLNLRLADMAPGSSRLFITGDVAPDLLGYSLLEQSLQDTFHVFQAPSDEDLAGAVSNVGIRSARAIREFLQTIKGAELEVDIGWTGADDHRRRWSGEYETISRLARSLSHFELREATQLSVVGEVVTLSLRGRFEIQATDRTYAGSFPSDLLRRVATVHIGDEVVASLERTTIRNTVTKVEKTDFNLISIEPTGQTRFSDT